MGRRGKSGWGRPGRKLLGSRWKRMRLGQGKTEWRRRAVGAIERHGGGESIDGTGSQAELLFLILPTGLSPAGCLVTHAPLLPVPRVRPPPVHPARSACPARSVCLACLVPRAASEVPPCRWILEGRELGGWCLLRWRAVRWPPREQGQPSGQAGPPAVPGGGLSPARSDAAGGALTPTS